ncbi:hypothetical protein Tco_0724104 [Tanacetum coccineum]
MEKLTTTWLKTFICSSTIRAWRQGSGQRMTREEAKTSSLQSRKDYRSGGSFKVAVSSSLRLLEPKRTIESRAKRSSINLVRTQHPSDTKDILKMEMEMEIRSTSDINAQDGDPLQDDVRLYLGDDLKKAQDHSQRHASKKHILNLLPKVITRIEGWHKWFFYVQDSIIPAKYPQLLSERNRLDLKSFKDKLPLNIEENPMFQRLSRYPTSVRVFPDTILFLAEMAFRNFIYTEDDEDLAFLPKEPSPGFGIGSASVSVNTEPLKANEEPEIQPVKVTADSGESPKPELFVVHPGSVAARIEDRKCKTRGGSSRPHVKRKLASRSSTSRATRAKNSSSKDDAPFLTVSDDDEGDNVVNTRSRELLQLIKKLKGECNVMRSKERAREEECEGLRVKCEAAMTDFEKNPAVVALREKISVLSTKVKEHKLNLDRMMLEIQKWAEKVRLEAVEVSLRKEVEELKQDRREVVSKVVPYAAMELVHSDDMGSLVGKLVSSSILYRRCRAYEQVADMKDHFDLSKVKGYRSSYKKDHT